MWANRIHYALVGLIAIACNSTDETNAIAARIASVDTSSCSAFLVGQLHRNRVVMLGDMRHGYGLYYRTVTEAINAWVTDAHHSSAESSDRRSLFLFLELDSITVSRISMYLASGDMVDALDPEWFMGDQKTLATIQFLSELRKVRLRVDSLNSTRPQDSKIQFDVVGPEKVLDIHRWSTEQRELFFIHKRDSLAFEGIRSVLDVHPHANALVFYGAAHLRDDLQVKARTPLPVSGYFLAHYLRNTYAEEGGVYSCLQVSIPSSPWLSPAFSGVTRSFAADNSMWDGLTISSAEAFPWGDGALFLREEERSSPIFTQMFSENLVDIILRNMQPYAESQGQFDRKYLSIWLTYLSFYFDRDSSQVRADNATETTEFIEELKRWRSATALDVVEDVSSNRLWKRVLDRIPSMSREVADEWLNYIATIVGFSGTFEPSTNRVTAADVIWQYIVNHRETVVFPRLVSILWIGTAEERTKAAAILRQETNQRFESASEWTHWLQGHHTASRN